MFLLLTSFLTFSPLLCAVEFMQYTHVITVVTSVLTFAYYTNCYQLLIGSGCLWNIIGIHSQEIPFAVFWHYQHSCVHPALVSHVANVVWNSYYSTM
jgi:hypothetical protein